MQIWLQKCCPQHLITKIVGFFANSRRPKFKNVLVRRFIQHYGVDMAEAIEPDYTQYPSFNEFFIRHLKPEARPITTNPNVVISPADGYISQIGTIENNRLFQAKGIYYSLESLLTNKTNHVESFKNGKFLTAYLAPKNYHRFHMPISGRLLEMIYVPGQLFSVNALSVEKIPALFSRNERVICIFQTEHGKMAFIAVGALIVGSITTSWHGTVNSPHRKKIQVWDYADKNIYLNRGEEIGYFKLGSTVIALFETDKIKWLNEMQAGCVIKMGQDVGTII